MNNSVELANYLKSKPGLKRLMIKLKEKYISLSKPSGTITIENLTKEESYDISNLLGRRIKEKDNVKTSYKELTKKINEGKYKEFDWLLTLESYFEEKIITKEESKLNKKTEEEKFYNEIFSKNKNRKYINYVRTIILEDESISQIIKQKYHKDKNELKRELNNILLLLDNIPKTPTSLAVYSSLTGNPHYLDLNKSSSSLFIKILSKIKNVEFKNNTKSKINTLEMINVYTDPISNFVITYKLKGNDILNKLNENNEVVNLNLLNIRNIDKIYTENNKVFIFENPSILLSLINLNIPVIITSGIPNISLYTLLHKLEKNNIEMFYNGDFDPEGLLIANTLKQEFPKIKLFCYDKLDYINSISREKISNSRLKKLDNINTNELEEIKKMLLSNKLSAYQEQNLNRIKEFIIKNK